MGDLNEKFLQVFEAIKKIINCIADQDDSIKFELNDATKRSFRVRNRRKELKYIQDVRNILSHPLQRSNMPTFVVTDGFITECHDVLAQISMTSKAGDLGIKRPDLYIADWKESIHLLIETMRKYQYSHIPILDTDGVVAGVFNESAILDYLVESDMASLIEPDATLEDLRKHCQLGADHTETFRFIDPKATEDEVVDVLVTVSGPSTRVGAVFVTLGAAPDRPIQRMITPWDVLEKR